jgi:hypothetical protein
MTQPMPPYRLLVAGARYVFPGEEEYICAWLEALTEPLLGMARPVTLVEGECPNGGVDLVAKRWGERTSGVTVEPHPAQWRIGKGAGPRRNAEMVAAGANLCAAFPRAAAPLAGTWDCVHKAAAAGIQVRIFPLVSVL